LRITPASFGGTLSRPLLAVAFCALAAGPGLTRPAGSQAPPSQPSFPAAIDQVVVDVVVTDREGRPVTGLAASDFLLSEDGVAQAIASFEAFTAREVPEPEPTDSPQRVSANPVTPIGFTGRTFAIVFDDARMTAAQAIAARKAVEDFLNHRVREGDRVLLAATSGEVFWGARLEEGRDELLAQLGHLEGLYVAPVGTDIVYEGEAFRIVVQRDAETFEHVVRRFKRGSGFNPEQRVTSPGDVAAPVAGFLDGNECAIDRLNPERAMVCELARTTYQAATARLRDSLGFLERVLSALDGVHGRKSVILVSPGFFHDSGIDEFRRVEAASRRANAPVSFLNASGLPGMPVEMSAVTGGSPLPSDLSLALTAQRDESAGAEVVAEATGGAIVRNRNDLSRGLRRIVDEESAYYLLGFTSTNEARDGRYRRLEVKLAAAPPASPGRGGWEVRSRKGYYAPGPRLAPAADGSEEARAAVLAPFDRAGVPLRLTAQVLEEKTPGKARCRLVGEVDVRALELVDEDGVPSAVLEVLFATAAPADGKWTPRGRRLAMKLPSGLRERLEREWYVVTDEVELPAGAYAARLVVRDAVSGRVGSVTHRLDVPDLDRVRLGTPAVADLLAPAAEGTPPWPAAIARREFAAGDRLQVGVQVFRPFAEKTEAPVVTARAEIVRPDGEPLTAVEARPMDAAPDGSLRRLLRLSLAGAIPGEHQLVVEAVGDAGRTLVWTEPFTVVAPAR
jgi:VWFA-related protein